MKQRYFIQLAFNGARFHGWQRQPDALSVQATLEEALSRLARESIDVTGAGRTDAGVHASRYVAHFDAAHPALDTHDFVRRLNSYLRNDVAISGIVKMPVEAHARFDAVARTYRYFMHLRKDPFLPDISWFYPYQPDIEAMNAAAALLIGRRDFTSFSKLHTDVKTNICSISCARWTLSGYRLTFTVTADRFLRNMVRAIVGTLLDVGRGVMPPAGIDDVLRAHDRCSAGVSVPACGLFLTDIQYNYPLPKMQVAVHE
ncbi:MAG: tRNA pseudouridine(38-40) synthase TruA [Bacteroidales bacterium]|jgi:tRNA pseudouridine38-40 synthase|nr:tRNA pseudouridine(38-40) synthase TruA [Bacteroidales bacterium]